MGKHVLPLSGQLDLGILTLQAFSGRDGDAFECAFFLQRFQDYAPIRPNLVMPVQMHDVV